MGRQGNAPAMGERLVNTWYQTLAEEPRGCRELIAAVLADWGKEWEEESHAGGLALSVLQYRGSQVEFSAACQLIAQGDARERQVGATILGELGLAIRPSFVAASIQWLAPLLEDPDPAVVTAAAFALGRRPHPHVTRYLIDLRNHPSAAVRHAVAVGLGGKTEEAALAALVELSADTATEVRDWATFGLGQRSEADSPAIRAALWARVRVESAHSDAFGEALVGLARRRDPALWRELLHWIEQGDPSSMVLNAAGRLGDQRLVAPLRALRAKVAPTDNPHWVSSLDEALEQLQQPAAPD